MSRTRSSAVSPGSATSTFRPCAGNAASRCSTPNLASRSRCSTTTTPAEGSDRIRLSFGRFPFSPEPTSVTTSPTACPLAVAHSASRATWRSRSRR